MMDEVRLRDIEKRLYAVENEIILSENNAQFAKEKVAELAKKIENLQAGIHRLVWTAGGLLIVAIGNFILRGGLNAAGV